MARSRPGFTTRATCLLAAGGTAILCGLLFGETDLVRAGIFAAAVPCVAAAVLHRSRVGIANSRGVEPSDVPAGQPVTVKLTIVNRSPLRSGALMLEDTLPCQIRGNARFSLDPLTGRESRPVTYRIPGLGRGSYRVGPLRVRLTDPFRMVDLTRSFSAYDDFVVSPVVDRLPAVDPPRGDDIGDSAGSRSVGSHGADDQSTREYRTGDDLRKIHWRSSARTGVLMVRQEERPWQGHTTVWLDTRASAHVTAAAPDTQADARTNSSFEWAVSAAASIGTHALVAGRRVGLIDRLGLVEPVRLAEPRALARRLADTATDQQGDLARVAPLLRSAAQESTLIAVLGRIDAAALRALLTTRAGGHSSPAFALVLDVDTWADPDAEVAATSQATSQATMAAAAALRSAGWRVTVVRHGDTTPQAWRLLLAGYSAGPREQALAR